MSNGGRRGGGRRSGRGAARPRGPARGFAAPALAAFAALALAPVPTAAVVATRDTGSTASAMQDPARAEPALERARDAQRDFERERRRHFPRHGWGSGRCDEHIGRFCLTHDGDDDWIPTPEPLEVAAARVELLAVLDQVADSVPGDRWVTGQRVAYRLEAGDVAGALAIVEPCLSDRWWCDALAALIGHRAGGHAEAAAAFDRARRALSPEARCRWDDISDLLSGDDAKAYGRTECGSPERRALEATFWHLSDPLWIEPGSERRVEHDARRVEEGLRSDAASGYGLGWGRDLAELTIRYGWPAGWDVAWRRDPGIRTERSIEAHRAPDAQRFAVEGIAGNEPPVWDLEDEEPRSTWAPPFGPVTIVDDPQVAAFRRGGRRLVVAAIPHAVPDGEDSAGCRRSQAAFLSSRDAILDRAQGPGRALAVIEPEGRPAALVGAEARCEDGGYAVRARIPLYETGEWLSDVLLLEPGAELPGTLDAALARVLDRSRVPSGGAVDVFWEWYGPDGPLEVTLSVTRRGKSLWRKALEWTGLADRGIESTGVRWSEAAPDEGPGRALRLELPELEAGTYELTLQVQSARVGSVSSTREIVVEGG